jgi:phosphoribosylformylglycinamidine cyclo-ligase
MSTLSRVLPTGTAVTVDRSTWSVPAVFTCIGERGHVAAEEMERTFNLGVGMIAIVAMEDADRALATLLGRHVPAWVAGTVAAGTSGAPGGVTLVGKHRG